MRPPRIQFWPLIVALMVACVVVSPAQEKRFEAPDVYLQGYLLMDDGLKLIDARKYADAYYKLRDARDIFDSVSVTYPNWNPDILEYRRTKVREKMEEAKTKEIDRRKKIAEGGGPAAAPLPGGRQIRPAIPERPAVPDAEPKEPGAAPRDSNAVVSQRLAELEKRISDLTDRNEELNQQLGGKKQELLSANRKNEELKSEVYPLQKKLANLQAKVDTSVAAKKREQAQLEEQVKELQTNLEKATRLLVEANEKNAALLTDLEGAYASIKTLGEERAALMKEKEQMVALIGGDSSPAKIKVLIAENEKLKKNLQETQAMVATLKKEKQEMSAGRELDQKMIADLQARIEHQTSELATLRAANSDYQEQMASLADRLDATEKKLGETGESVLSEPEAVAENKVLREIIFSQLKQQSSRERAKERVLALLTENGKLSDDLLGDLNDMAKPFEMTKEERAILQATRSTGDSREEGEFVFLPLDENHPATPRTAPSSGDLPSEIPPLPSSNPRSKTGALDKAGLSDELRAYATAAEAQFGSSQFVQARENFLKVLKAEPQNVYALCNLGVVELRLKKNEDAIAHLTDALAYRYDNSGAHYLLGMAYHRMGKLPQAADSVREALKLDPRNAQGHLVLAMIYKAQSKTESFISELKSAVEIDDSCADAHYNLAVHYALTNQLPTARKHYAAARKNGATRDSKLEKFLQI